MRRALTLSTIDGMFFALMVGAGESYMGALAVELGHDSQAIALLATVPPLAGALAQFGVGTLARWLKSRKRVVVFGAYFQALLHLAFVWMAFTHERSLAFFLFFKTVYWMVQCVIAAPWSAWIATLIVGRARQRWFGIRSALCQGALLVSFVGSGWIVRSAPGLDLDVLQTLGLLQLAALSARVVSASCLAAQGDPRARMRQPTPQVSLRDVVRKAPWTIPLHCAALMFGAHLAVPFFTPYMLEEMQLDYREYALLVAIAILLKTITMPFLPRLSAKLGMSRILFLSGILVAVVSLLWAVSASFPVLAFAQVLSGCAWGAYEYSSFQLLLSSTPGHQRMAYLAMSNSLTGTAQVIGALVGSYLISALGLDYRSVFLASAVVRFLPVLTWLRRIPQPREVLRVLDWRSESIRPGGGSVVRPIVDEQDDVELPK